MIIHVLGTAQDGGYPHAGCKKTCCTSVWEKPELHRLPCSIAVIDQDQNKFYLFDITPNIKEQLHRLEQYNCELAGVFITHAHVGHYLGLMDLGLEIMNTHDIPIFIMPRMKNFIINNAPLNQLLVNQNIRLMDMFDNKHVIFDNLSVLPFNVPHRNELSETVGFRLLISNKSIIYLPDIDDWDEWDIDLREFVIDNDILFLDGTFFNKDELKSRDISKIPHPEIIDTMSRLSQLSLSHKKKVHFIHFNHTNGMLENDSDEFHKIINQGFSITQENQKFKI